MHSKLELIITEKKKEIARLKKENFFNRIVAPPGPMRGFRKAVLPEAGTVLIAEIKFASPSAGIIRQAENPVGIAQRYERAGAAAISFLTERFFFKGDPEELARVKQATTTVPILRKDFILDEIQVREALFYGADAVLLIARILATEQLKNLLQAARELGLGTLTEVHDRRELDLALECGADLIGINNRDLDTFEVDLQTTRELAPLVPADRGPVCESGIHTTQDIRSLNPYGIKAFLVGTAVMQAESIEMKIRELIEAWEGENV